MAFTLGCRRRNGLAWYVKELFDKERASYNRSGFCKVCKVSQVASRFGVPVHCGKRVSKLLEQEDHILIVPMSLVSKVCEGFSSGLGTPLLLLVAETAYTRAGLVTGSQKTNVESFKFDGLD